MPLTALDFGRGRVLPIDKALEAAANGQLDQWPYELLRAVLDVQQDRGDKISTTTLLAKCPRSEYLKRKTDYTDQPEKLWPAWRGTMFHGQLEFCSHPGNIAEARYYAELPSGDILTCSPDLVSPHLGQLIDYKTCEEAPRSRPWENQVQQVQINRWIVDHAFKVEYDGTTYDLFIDSQVTGDRMVNLTNRERFVPAEWDSLWLIYLTPKKPVSMRVSKSIQIPTVDGKKTKAAKVPDIWTDAQVESLIYPLYEERKQQLSGGELPPIPKEFDRQQHPLCQWCPVRSLCWDLAMDGQ